MAVKKADDTEFNKLRKALNDGDPENLYIFHGEERYLLEHSLKKLRELADANGMGSFNHRRFDGKGFTAEKLCEAVEALPAFADRTLVEVHDYNIFKADEETRNRIADILEELPDYICLVFVFDTVEYAPDQRLKTTKRILKNAHVVDFSLRGKSELIRWVTAHYKAAGKAVSADDAEYLVFITGGVMTTLAGEIEKTAAYASGNTVTRKDIDAVVTPAPDAVAYKLTDAIAAKKYDEAAEQLDKLLQMREPPHKLIYSISMKMRQLYMARLCIERGAGAQELVEITGMRDFQARNMIASAMKISAEDARQSVIHCANTAFSMNSGTDPAEAVTELLIRLASQMGRI